MCWPILFSLISWEILGIGWLTVAKKIHVKESADSEVYFHVNCTGGGQTEFLLLSIFVCWPILFSLISWEILGIGWSTYVNVEQIYIETVQQLTGPPRYFHVRDCGLTFETSKMNMFKINIMFYFHERDSQSAFLDLLARKACFTFSPGMGRKWLPCKPTSFSIPASTVKVRGVRVSTKKCQVRVSYKSVKWEVSSKSVIQDCQGRVCYKSAK